LYLLWLLTENHTFFSPAMQKYTALQHPASLNSNVVIAFIGALLKGCLQMRSRGAAGSSAK
jgi:hypothetical protein